MGSKDETGERPAFLAGGGELGRLIAEFDWSATNLGPIRDWPGHVKTSIALALRSPAPIVMLWGDDGTMVYNDAYAVFADKRHPASLGAKVREAWPEVADFNDHVLKTVLSGKTLSYRDQEMTLHRKGAPEQVWLDLDYSPIVDEDGVPVSVLVVIVETTDKVRFEQALASERERLQQMFSQAPSFMALLSGPEHVFDFVNPAYRQLVGHRDVIGKPVRKALPDIASQGYFELLDQVYATGEPFVGNAREVVLQSSPGGAPEERLVDFVYQPMRNAQGDVVGIFVEGTDITERVAAERALRRIEGQFRIFAEAMPNHVWTAPLDGQLDWFNPQVYEYSGAKPGELDGHGWAQLVHPDDTENVAKRWEASLASGEPYEVEFRLRRADGQYRWHVARAVLIRDSEDQPTRWIGTNTDIEDQRRVRQRLLDSERRLRLSQGAAGIASMEVDVASGEIFASDQFWELLGLAPRPSIHTSEVEAIVLPQDRKVSVFARPRRDGAAKTDVEYRIKRPDTGAVRWISHSMEFQYDSTGEPAKVFGAMRDITEEKEADARQIMLTRELAHRTKNILAMVAAIASQTLRGNDMDAARNALNERLRALANAHDILNRAHWTSASLSAVVASSIAAFPVERIAADGPQVMLEPKRALTLALAVNELGTNALKYGALSVPKGHVDISWSGADAEDGGTALTWTWRERGGPKVVAPERRGFGSTLIERILATDFDGTARMEFKPEGVECVLNAPWPTPKRPG